MKRGVTLVEQDSDEEELSPGKGKGNTLEVFPSLNSRSSNLTFQYSKIVRMDGDAEGNFRFVFRLTARRTQTRAFIGEPSGPHARTDTQHTTRRRTH